MEKDNYELVVQYDKKRFLAGDPRKMAEYAQLSIKDDKYIIVPHFIWEYAVDIESGDITYANGCTEEVPVMERMVTLHHLIEVKPYAQLTGEFVTIHSLKDASIHEKAFNNRSMIPLAKYFEGNLDEFIEVSKIMGAKKTEGGDYAFILYAFPTIPLKFLFWDGDDEVSAATNILFDKSITDFTHPEDTIGLGEMGADHILEAAKKLHRNKLR